ncbi:putative carboxylesterase 18 [Iris pallida]|uniref:Carboxylesterase 18 n=1 Tax=Iris pallida TaxID=29817 RepID=A0AAX6FBE4_IRIPA|nr:putative carboxylesterase 18 [Iris pallida]
MICGMCGWRKSCKPAVQKRANGCAEGHVRLFFPLSLQ